MPRRKPLRRTALKRGTARVGAAAARRRRTGGRHSAGYRSLPVREYGALVEDIRARAGHRCEAPWCRRKRNLDPAHWPKRTQPGAADDADHIVALCRLCHNALDEARTIRVEPLGEERFQFERQQLTPEGSVAWHRYPVYQRARKEPPCATTTT